jgi:hypothetical protein
MIYEVGNKVRVNLDPNEQIHSAQEVWNHQGKEARISRRKIIAYGARGLQRATYYELEGINSRMGVPFSFMEEQLTLIND